MAGHDDIEHCELCNEPRHMRYVTWRGMRLCRGHWREALAGKIDPDDVGVSIARSAMKAQDSLERFAAAGTEGSHG